jgi:3-hydroxymyristoyl/3-hydroxydecanoyl-(acyl carrier protein) dehydratase
MMGLPEISARRENESDWELDFTVRPDCPWLDGHFPGNPILPGVVQVGWAAHFARQLLARDLPPPCLHRIKFMRPVLPGARLTLRLQAEADRVRFEYFAHEADAVASVSSGALDFAVAP